MQDVTWKATVVLTLGLGFSAMMTFAAAPSAAKQLYIYPNQGQSAEQQDKDRYECHSWAVQQTGYDPSNPPPTQASSAPPPPQPEASQGGLLRGGARGAAVGAVGGAIAGDAGKGAAIGAATGALFGGMRRRDQRRRQAQEQANYNNQVRQQQAQQQQASSAGSSDYNRAMTACLNGRGYTVN